MGNPFDGEEPATTAVATEEPVHVTDLDEVETEEPDADVDVDSNATADDETEEAPATPPVKNVKQVGAAKTTSSRKPVAEGYVAPVEAAKRLSEHLTIKGREAGLIGADQEIEIKPQVMYSYIKNNGPDSKNPLPRYTDPELTGGRECVVKVAEVIKWWEDKDARVSERKANAKVKADKKAENAKKAEAPAEAEDAPPTGVVVEAE
jgi:hypothetical protein